MKPYFSVLILFFCLNIPQCLAQDQRMIDSLLNSLANHQEDSLKVKTLSALFNLYLYNDQEKAKAYAHQELMVSRKIGFNKGVALSLYQLGIVHGNLDQIDSGRIYYKKSLEAYTAMEDIDGVAEAKHGLAILEYYQGNYPLALALTDENIHLYRTVLNDSTDFANTLDFKGIVYTAKGNYQLALSTTLDALKLLEHTKEPFRKADVLNHLGTIEFFLENFERSLEYNSSALEYYRENNDKYFETQALNDMGNTYYYLKNYQKAEEFLLKSLELSKMLNIPGLKTSALTNLGKIYHDTSRYDKSLEILQQSLDVAESIDQNLKITEALNVYGKVYNTMRQPEKALPILNRAIGISDSIQANEHLRTAFFNRAESFALIGDYKKAFKDHKEYKKVSDSIYNTTKSKQIEELRTIYETEKKEAEIVIQRIEIQNLNQEVEISNLRKGLYAGGMLSFAAMSGLLFFGFRQRIKKNKIAREKQEEIYKQEIEFKKKELASQTLHLVQKNTFIQELKENLEKIKQSPELFKVEFRRLVMLLKKQNAEDKDWEVFKSYFAEVHDNFDNKLKQLAQDITDKEIRLAAFLRMNLSTKEIAAMFNVIPASILTSKYRLKKKLGLEKQQDLTSFLKGL